MEIGTIGIQKITEPIQRNINQVLDGIVLPLAGTENV